MAGKIGRLIGRLLRGKRPKVPKAPARRSQESLGGGHRGIAAGNTAKPDFSEENIGKWTALTGDQVENFVYEAEPFYVHSTNVRMAQFFIDDQKLLVEFREGPAYLYDNVTEDEAVQFAKAQSKGAFVWDILRLRGSRSGHKKPYRKVSSGWTPPKREPEEVEMDGDIYEVVREAGGAVRYRLKS